MAMRAIATFLLPLCLMADGFPAADVKILGALDYGQTSEAVNYSGSPKYDAFLFNGNGGERIQVTVRGGGGKAAISIADGGLQELASGKGQLTYTIPNRGPDMETFYILFRDPDGKAARFTVMLEKLEKRSAQVQREHSRAS